MSNLTIDGNDLDSCKTGYSAEILSVHPSMEAEDKYVDGVLKRYNIKLTGITVSVKIGFLAKNQAVYMKKLRILDIIFNVMNKHTIHLAEIQSPSVYYSGYVEGDAGKVVKNMDMYEYTVNFKCDSFEYKLLTYSLAAGDTQKLTISENHLYYPTYEFTLNGATDVTLTVINKLGTFTFTVNDPSMNKHTVITLDTSKVVMTYEDGTKVHGAGGFEPTLPGGGIEDITVTCNVATKIYVERIVE